MPVSSTFPFDTSEFRLAASQIPFLRRWYERSRRKEYSHYDARHNRASRMFWPGFFLSFDIHLHLATYAVSDLPHWPSRLSLLREQPVAQLAIRCPFFCLVLAYRAYEWDWTMRWRSEIAFYYHPVPGWRFTEGGQLFEKERRWKFSEWFLSEHPIRLENGGYKNEIKFERVY